MQQVVFICEHGGAKSVIAAEYFSRIAAARELALRGEAAGVDPYEQVPSGVVSGLAAKGIDVSRYKPQAVSLETFANAALVVRFGCDAATPTGCAVEDWGDVPAVSEGFDRAHEVIVERVERLVERIAGSPRPGQRTADNQNNGGTT
jgi:arsenate reductase (thioredoxin)